MRSEDSDTKICPSDSASREKMRRLLCGLLTSSDAAKALNMSQSSIRGLLNSGELKPLGATGQTMVFWSEDVHALKSKRAEWRKGKR